jgi:hypothetical protein
MREFLKCNMHIAVAVKPRDRAILFSRADEKLFQCSAEVSPVQWVQHRSRWEISADEWAVSLSMFSQSVQPITESVGYSSKSDFHSILSQVGNKENMWCMISCNLYRYWNSHCPTIGSHLGSWCHLFIHCNATTHSFTHLFLYFLATENWLTILTR